MSTKRPLEDRDREIEQAPPETLEEWISDAKGLAFDRLIPQLVTPSEDDQFQAIFHRVQIPPTVKTSRAIKSIKLDAEREHRVKMALERMKMASSSLHPNPVVRRQQQLAKQYKEERDAFRKAVFGRQLPSWNEPLPLDQLVSVLTSKTEEIRAIVSQDQKDVVKRNGTLVCQRPLWEILEEERRLIDDPRNPRPVSYMEPNEFGVRLVSPTKLFQHQIEMVRWLIQRETVQHPSYITGRGGGIMAMEMGLGKTLCLITLTLTTLSDQRRARSPTIYTCPKSLLYQVRQEFIKFGGSQLKVMIYHRDALGAYMDTLSFRDILEADVIITTYEVLRNIVLHGTQKDSQLIVEDNDPCLTLEEDVGASHDNIGKASFHAEWIRHTWFRLILDESHCIREHKTQLFKTICQLKSPRRICSTGTPLHNSIRDVYNQLIFTGLAVPKQYARRLNKKTLTELRAWNCLNFVEESVLTDVKLPEKRMQVIYFDLGPEEQEVYTYYRRRTIDSLEALKRFGISKERQTFAAVVNFLRLLQVCTSAYLSLPSSYKEKYESADRAAKNMEDEGCGVPTELVTQGSKMSVPLQPLQVDETALADVEQLNVYPWMIQRSGTAGIRSSKMRQVVDTVNAIHTREPGAKILIFTNLYQILRLTMDAFEQEPRYQQLIREGHKPFGSIYGSKSMNERHQDILRFQDDPHTTLLFLTLKTGGTGLNLTVAHHVIFIDPWYTYAPLYQAEKRAHRIGQTQPVYVYYMIARDTVEERVYAKAMERKSEAEDVSRTKDTDRLVLNAEFINTMLTVNDVRQGQQNQLPSFAPHSMLVSSYSSYSGDGITNKFQNAALYTDIISLDNISSSSESDVDMG